jgi:class 3 adenylate cyclase
MDINSKKAAVMVTDIVGYSALMSDDVRKAMEILEKNRIIHKAAIRKFKGKFVKEIGDGTVSMFDSTMDAVRTAMEIWKTCCKEVALNLRIGIHTGNIIIRYSDILGDGVNIASTIENCGLPKGIYLSEKAFEDIRGRKDVRAEFHTEKTIGGCPKPLRIYSIPIEKMQKRLFKKKSLQSDTIS